MLLWAGQEISWQEFFEFLFRLCEATSAGVVAYFAYRGFNLAREQLELHRIANALERQRELQQRIDSLILRATGRFTADKPLFVDELGKGMPLEFLEVAANKIYADIQQLSKFRSWYLILRANSRK